MNGGRPDERQGILSYRPNSMVIPTTERAEVDTRCRDEPFERLRPYLYWNITKPSEQEEHELINEHPFEVGLEEPSAPDGRPFPCDKFFRWSMGKEPMYLNFSDPTILNLAGDPKSFPNRKVVVDYPQDSWVYMIITGMASGKTESDVDRKFVPAAHPVSKSLPHSLPDSKANPLRKLDASSRPRLRPPPAIR